MTYMAPRRAWPLVAMLFLAGCDLVSPTSIGLPNLPGNGTMPRVPGTSTPVTGDLAAREATVQPLAARHAAENGLPTGLVMAVIAQESAFQAHALSPAGAEGLMQLMPATVDDINARAPGIHIADAYDADQNVSGGCWYLGWLHGALPAAKMAPGDDWKFALASYNGGIGRVEGAIAQAWDGDSSHTPVAFDDVSELLPAETRNYVPAVLSRWQGFGN